MNARDNVIAISLPFLLAASLFAQEPQKPEIQKSEIQTRADALMERARHLSDIRAKDAPAFQLKATFSFVSDDLDTVQGTYTETWVSGSQWRRETVVGDLRHIEVGGSDKHWLLYPDGFPTKANEVPTLMVFPTSSFAFASITEHVTPAVTADCATTKPVIDDGRFTFCFEKKSGVLLEKVIPTKRPRNLVNFVCEYGTFRKFGDYSFPREVVCFEDRHKTISANVVGLSMEPPIDQALFEPPRGAIELGRCLGKAVPPTLSGNEVMFPGLDLDHVVWLKIWFVIDVKGKPQDVKVLRSVAKDSHEKALNTVRSWRFKPGTCDGKTMPMPMTMEIPSTPR